MLTTSFFFKCNKYNKERVEHFTYTWAYHPLSLNKFLFGNSDLLTENNFIIFAAVHKFIKESKITADT